MEEPENGIPLRQDGNNSVENNTLMDAFVPGPRNRPAPLVVFFHGGYWRAGDKREMSMIAGPLLDAGVAVAIPGYDLCPTVTVPVIMDQNRNQVRTATPEPPSLVS